jgi:hypothetical protein
MAKKKFEQAAKDTGIDLLIGIGGAVAGAFIGKPSLFAGAGLHLFGQMQDKDWAKKAGLTMALAGGYNTIAPAAKTAPAVVSGLDDAENYGEGIDGFSLKEFMKGGGDRVKNFFSVMKDKAIPFSTKPKTQTTSGIGEVFINPFSGMGNPEIMGLGNSEIMGSDNSEIMGAIAEEYQETNGINSIGFIV